MDPITTSILAAIVVGAAKVGAQVLVDAYGRLEELPVKEFETNSKLAVDTTSSSTCLLMEHFAEMYTE
jgi:hypothetical protein